MSSYCIFSCFSSALCITPPVISFQACSDVCFSETIFAFLITPALTFSVPLFHKNFTLSPLAGSPFLFFLSFLPLLSHFIPSFLNDICPLLLPSPPSSPALLLKKYVSISLPLFLFCNKLINETVLFIALYYYSCCWLTFPFFIKDVNRPIPSC